jgi:tetratricopeptide (TPR) repeat protein
MNPKEVHAATPRIRTSRLSFDTASIWVLTLTIALAGVAFIPVASVPFVFTKVAILAIGGLVALALFILARLTRGNLIVPPVTLIGAFWLVPIAYMLSLLFSGANFSTAFFGNELDLDTAGFMIILAAVATLSSLVFRRAAQYRTFFTVGGIFLAVVLISQVIFLVLSHVIPNSVSATANVVGSFADLGMIVGLGIAAALLSFRFITFSKRTRIAVWVGLVVGLLLLALVNSSIIWILVALVSLGLFIESILRRSASIDDTELDGVETLSAEVAPEVVANEVSRPLAAPLVVLVIALFFLIGGSTIGNALGTSFGTSSLDVRPSWQSTFEIGSHTYASSPIFGSGPNTFGQQWLRFRDASLNGTVFWSVAFTSGIGSIPTAFVTTGLVGALAWMTFLGLFLFLGARSLLFKSPADSYVRFVAVTSYVGAWYVFILAIFAVPGPIVLISGFALAGIFVSTLRYAGARQEWGVIFARNPRIGFLIVFGLTLLLLGSVVAAYSVVEHYLADTAYAEASTALTAGNLDKATTAINRSVTFTKSDRSYQLAALIGVAQMNKIASNTALTPAQAQQQFQAALSASVAAATNATKLGPANYQNWAVLGEVYQVVVPLNIDGAYAQSKAAYQHAITLDPTDPTLPYTLAQLDIAQKDYTSAQADLTKAISLKSDYTQAIFLLSQLEVQEGKAKEALQAAEAAAYFDPTDPTILFQVGILRSANGDNQGAINALAQAVQLNPKYANAQFFLGVMYAQAGNNQQALVQLQAVAALSSDNAKAIAADIASLEAGKNPFPATSLGALGIPQPGVTDQSASSTPATATTTVGH